MTENRQRTATSRVLTRRAHLVGVVAGFWTLGFGSAALAQAASTDPSGGAFLKEFRRAHEAKDVDAAMRLVHWEGADAAMKKSFAANFKDEFAMAIDKIEFAPTPPGRITQYTRNGKTFKPNLGVKRVLVVRFKPQPGAVQLDSTTYLIGEKDGRTYITPPVPTT